MVFIRCFKHEVFDFENQGWQYMLAGHVKVGVFDHMGQLEHRHDFNPFNKQVWMWVKQVNMGLTHLLIVSKWVDLL